MSRGFKDLKVYQMAYQLAMRIFHESKRFPPEERFSLTDQARRSSRSVTANVAEAYRKRQYPNAFLSKLADADGECAETQVWIDYGRDCGYWSEALAAELTAGYEEVGRMLGGMITHPEKFCG
ncbi:MAG: four helix bundle protein [Planctomycetes bacterium]|nr:four helix bundle protein [Planctomycetota bacterium]